MTKHTAATLPGRDQTSDSAGRHRVVIIGGGAAGLELATQLGRHEWLSVTLVDKARSHIWKPKLHEIAAGSMNMGRHEVGYLAHARDHGFVYRMGEMTGLDRQSREVAIAPFVDGEGEQITPARTFPYDTLVLAVGSQSNDFGTPGVKEHALKLECLSDAARFNRKLMNACFRAQSQEGVLAAAQLRVCIIGAGATGVELAAELLRTGREVIAYGASVSTSNKGLEIHLVEAADRILPALPPRLSAAAHKLLTKQGISVHVGAKVARVHKNGVELSDGELLPAEITVWAAGVRAPDFLRSLPGLEANRINQLVVRPTLQTTNDPRVFAIGDCAACAKPDGRGFVPPRAQAAHQQAAFLARHLPTHVEGRPLPNYTYRDFGSLVSLGSYSTVGNLMGGVVGKSMFVEGVFAKLMYLSMYKMHEAALHGWRRVTLETLARCLEPSSGSRVKLH
ncbi:NAD(P)/FAD-dependent oxidoreductase [Variovorax sp. J22R115]|uniref:NAD(P)/FAD-dependent oxidoreductase n=1 Tax=Variovorax sp. J22R115 TaxID=3053509 RepID=UPI0025763815|nr:NAD(P)/FAD-dependent oxidoreductase [Variovorax sp. J22R115]MDM0048839.1 NAD(P)/FAD-dependent oxidoreductase [Variovorax sp. J22R115]